MLIRKLFVPNAFSPEGTLSAYLLWPSDREITVRVTIPDSVRIVNTFNSVPNSNSDDGSLLFSRFTIEGYLGLIFARHFENEIPGSVTLGFEIKTGIGLSEVYEKTITRSSVGNDMSLQDPGICRSRDTGGFAEVHDVPPASYITLQGQGEQEERSAISAAFEQVFRKTNQISADLNEEFRIDGRALTILCPERKLKYDQIISPKNAWPLPKTVKFTSVVPSRVVVMRIPELIPVPESVVYTDDGYKLKLNFLTAGERYLLSLEYDFEGCPCLSRLIENVCSITPPKEENDRSITCEVSALIKYPDILSMGGYAVALRDYEIVIDIPLQGKSIDQTVSDEQNSSSLHGGSHAHSKDISPFRFTPDLQKYIEVQKDFSFQSAQWFCDGAAYSAGTIRPSNVKIAVRTDLSLAKPAADGTVSL
jgi:hypothetical protein